MALNERQQGFLTGLLAGAGAALAVWALRKPLREVAAPVAKAGVRAAMDARDWTEERLARAGESLDDLVAEVRAERAAARTPASGEPGPAPGGGAG
jgi:hypothetical protein